ncbi:MAG: hypothetical protein N3G74_00260 [Candidatus Micrarchaeota archaeon]|nr:hypothetical protein [Candidatus Micrarchaeota archaeon]
MTSFIVPIDRPNKIKDINRESIAVYQRTIHSIIPLLEDFAIEPFESGLKEKSGYSDANPPKCETESVIKVDGIKFRVISTPTTKRPQYSLAYEQIIDYTCHLIEEHKRIGRIKDITLIDRKPFVSLDLLIEKIKSVIESVKVGKEGITQKIEYDANNIVTDVVNTPSFALDISKTNDPDIRGSARIYLMAKSIKSDYEEIKKKFENLIKERTGYSKDNLPEKRKDIIMTDVPGYAILVKIIPTVNISFSKIVNSLIYETPSGKITEKTGLLIKAMYNAEEPKLEGLIIKKGDKKFVSLEGFSSLLESIKEENKERTVRFEITTTALP